jgi:hypothetical protein
MNRLKPIYFGSHIIKERERKMSLGIILIIILILALVGIIPVWPHSRSWGYAPGGVVGVVVIILVILLLMGRI